MNQKDKTSEENSPSFFAKNRKAPPLLPLSYGDESSNLDAANVAQWRKRERERLLKQRLALSPTARQHKTQLITGGLDDVLGTVQDRTLSVYWPFHGEPNLIQWVRSIINRGACVALPVVVEKGKPLLFKSWTPGEPLGVGIWDLPVPIQGSDVTPSIMIIPLVGFDDFLFRLGYGGGYFDRTLATCKPQPRTIGVGFELCRIPTIYPQSYDIPMDVVITESEIYRSSLPDMR